MVRLRKKTIYAHVRAKWRDKESERARARIELGEILEDPNKCLDKLQELVENGVPSSNPQRDVLERTCLRYIEYNEGVLGRNLTEFKSRYRALALGRVVKTAPPKEDFKGEYDERNYTKGQPFAEQIR